MAVDRTLPTSAASVAGQSPIDVYVDNELPAVYVETNLSETLNAAMTTVEVVTNCTLVSGGIVQGLNVTVTLGESSTFGTTACGIYAKVDLGAQDKSVHGRTSVIEARLDVGASASEDTMSLLCLDWNNLCTGASTTWNNSYIMLRDRVEDNDTSCIRTLLNFYDHEALDYGGVTVGSHVIQDTSTGGTHNVSIACGYGAGNTKFWLMGTTTAPD